MTDILPTEPPPLLHETLAEQVTKGHIRPVGPLLPSVAAQEAFRLADAIREEPRISSVQLNSCNLGEEALLAILGALKGKAQLHHLALDDNRITPRCAAKLAEVLPTLPKLKSLRLNNTQLNADTLRPIAGAIKGNSNMVWLAFSQNRLGNEGVEIACDTAASMPNLAHFRLMSCQLTPEDLPAITGAICRMPQLYILHLHDNPEIATPLCQKAIAQSFLQQDHANIYSVKEDISALNPLLQRNASAAIALRKTLLDHQDKLHTLPCAEIAKMLRFQNIMRFFRTGENAEIWPLVVAFSHFLNQEMPALAPSQPVTWEALTQRDDNSLTPLDNPATWQNFKAISNDLLKQGVVVNKTLLQSGTNSRGENWLECGLAYAPDVVIPLLNAHGQSIGPNDLLEPQENIKIKPEPNRLMGALVANGRAAKSIFTPLNCMGQPVGGLQRLYVTLPPEQQQTIPHYRGLMLRLFNKSSSAHTAHTARGR